MGQDEGELLGRTEAVHHLDHGLVEGGDAGKRPLVPGLVGDRGGMLEHGSQGCNERRLIHLVKVGKGIGHG